jgi:putative ABC transport system ATP-binding protein
MENLKTNPLALKAVGIFKTYFQGETKIEVLSDLHFEIAAGQSIAILGESGSGKSTLLGLLAGLDKPDKGAVFYSDQNLNLLDENEITSLRSKHMGIIFQQFHLLDNLTALENVGLPLRILGLENSENTAIEALKSVGLINRMHHYPRQLSGGECQRVAIARALVLNPTILLADEPSGNLDLKTGRNVMDLLFKLARDKNTALVLVTHNHELSSHTDRTYQLLDGQLKLCS